jgi:putative addiction module component (TIGR02574 family)
MNTESQQLLQSALTLPETDRAQIAASLIHSLDSELSSDPSEDVDAAWAAEIQRRIESIDNGEVKLIAWDQVMREMSERRHG